MLVLDYLNDPHEATERALQTVEDGGILVYPEQPGWVHRGVQRHEPRCRQRRCWFPAVQLDPGPDREVVREPTWRMEGLGTASTDSKKSRSGNRCLLSAPIFGWSRNTRGCRIRLTA